MAVTAPVSLSGIVAEFGGPGNLAAYIRGGGYVPNIPANAAISTTVEGLAMSQFEGAVNSVPLSGSIAPLLGIEQDLANPRPPSTSTVYAGGSATVSGGSGNYTYSWAVTSGEANISGGTAGKGVTIYATVHNWGIVSGNIRCIVSDGSSSITLTTTYSLRYEGGTPI